jgi:hypothetical protein
MLTAICVFNDLVYAFRLISKWIIQCVPLTTKPGTEDIAMKFEQEYIRCVRNEAECL